MPLTDDFFTGDPETAEAVFTLADASTIVVSGIFRDASDAADSYGMQIEATNANFECETSEIAGVAKDDTVEIDSVTYTKP